MGLPILIVELHAVFEPPLALTLLGPERRRKVSAGWKISPPTATMRASQPFGEHDGNLSVAPGIAGRRRCTDCNRAPGERSISLAPGAGRSCTCPVPWRAETGARPRAH